MKSYCARGPHEHVRLHCPCTSLLTVILPRRVEKTVVGAKIEPFADVIAVDIVTRVLDGFEGRAVPGVLHDVPGATVGTGRQGRQPAEGEGTVEVPEVERQCREATGERSSTGSRSVAHYAAHLSSRTRRCTIRE